MILHSAYAQTLLPGVLRPEIGYRYGFKEWLLNGSWSPTAGLTKKQANLSLHDPTELADCCVVDAIAFASAAFESALAFPPNLGEPRSCAWQVISYYYSAYFAANALMRLSGTFCVNLDARHCSEINERYALYEAGGGSAKSIQPALFLCFIMPQDRSTLAIRSLDGVRGGVHMQFWEGFSRFIDTQKTELLSSPMTPKDKKDVRLQLDSIRQALSFSGSANSSWLSEFRNSVNYRFEHGLWHPYEGSDLISKNLLSSLSNTAAGNSTLCSPNEDVPEAERLVRVSGVLIGWLFATIKLLFANSRRGKKKLLQDGAVSFANRLGLT